MRGWTSDRRGDDRGTGGVEIGRQVETEFGGLIDLLCVDAAGDLVVVELKRDKTPRKITAQALDYASWVVDLTHERVTSIAKEYLSADFGAVFEGKFGSDVPETLNGDHRVLIVGSVIDPSSDHPVPLRSPRDEHKRRNLQLPPA